MHRLMPLVLVAACTDPAAPPPAIPGWEPGVVYATPRAASARGFLDRRGLIHAHSVYSHDACDGEPVDENGARDTVCFDDFRRGLCQTRHDFVMLTDHRDAFDHTEYPDALLYREERGDVLVERGGDPVASWAACDDGSRALVMAGNESELMPVGLERHPVPEAERGSLYGSRTPETMTTLREHGAVVLIAHTEQFSADELSTWPLDGFEMFNLHANLMINAGEALEMLLRARDEEYLLSHPDLVLLPILSEDPRYLETWGTVLARGVKRVTTMGTDCHRNTFPGLLDDGERVDSYRRMMLWFSNHLLVRPDDDGGWDDRHLKEALAAGRLYGAFELLGYPRGFDFHARAASGAVVEMGGEATVGATLVVARPEVLLLDGAVEPPEVSLHLLRAREGGWDEVLVADDGDLSFAADVPGAYRVEVRMVPLHLSGHLNDDEDVVLGRDYVWIYSNPIYVRDPS